MSREEVLRRVRAALAAVPGDESPTEVPVTRDYADAHFTGDEEATVALLSRNLADYRAMVHHCAVPMIADTVAGLLAVREARTLAVPAGLPPDWLTGVASTGVQLVPDASELTAARLDRIDSVLTGCALAVAETGTLVLDGGPGQGRRALSLVPDHHICVVRVPEQVVVSVPRALRLLAPDRPQTWISGPSATSDIELHRVEGVHGPRALDVVLATV